MCRVLTTKQGNESRHPCSDGPPDRSHAVGRAQHAHHDLRHGAEVRRGCTLQDPQGRSPGFREKGSAPKRGRHSAMFCSSNASVQWQPDGLAIPTKKWFLGAGFLGAPPISPEEMRSLAVPSAQVKGLESEMKVVGSASRQVCFVVPGL